MAKALLIVEGLKDREQIQKAFESSEERLNVTTLVTEGTKMNNRIRAEIEGYIRKGYDPYILSDPDEAGEHLAHMIQYWYPEIPRIEVDIKECTYFTGKKIKAGIEYSSYDYLKEIVYPLIGVRYERKKYPICWD